MWLGMSHEISWHTQVLPLPPLDLILTLWKVFPFVIFISAWRSPHFPMTRPGLMQVIVSLGDVQVLSHHLQQDCHRDSDRARPKGQLLPGCNKHAASSKNFCLLGRSWTKATAQRSATEAAVQELEQISWNRACNPIGPQTKYRKSVTNKKPSRSHGCEQ